MPHSLFQGEYLIISLGFKYIEGMGSVQGPSHVGAWFFDIMQYPGSEASGIMGNWCHCGNVNGGKYVHDAKHLLENAVLKYSVDLRGSYSMLYVA